MACFALRAAAGDAALTVAEAYSAGEQLCIVGKPILLDSHPSCMNGAAKFEDCWHEIVRAPDSAEVQIAIAQSAAAAKEEKLRSRYSVQESTAALPIPGFASALPNMLPGRSLNAVQAVGNKLSETHTLGAVLGDAFLSTTRSGVDLYYFDVQGRLFLAPSPDVNPALAARLGELNQGALLEAERNNTSPFDDVLYEVNVSPVTRWFGRDWLWYADAWHNLAAGARSAVETDSNGTIAEVARVRSALADELMGAEGSKARSVASCLGGAYEIHKLQRESAAQYLRLNRFGRLVSNQPQLVYTRRELQRHKSVGVNSHSNRLTVSTGIWNNLFQLGLFDSRCNFLMASQDGKPGACVEAFREFAGNLFANNEISASAFFEWGNFADFSFHIPANGLPGPLGTAAEDFMVPGGTYKQWGGVLGMKVTVCDQGDSGRALEDADFKDLPQKFRLRGQSSCRLDLAYEKTEYSEKIFRLGETVRRLTFTYRKGPVSFPIHLIYRQGAEFRVEAHDKVGIAVGTNVSW